MINIDDLFSINIFKNLSPDILAEIIPRLEERTVPAGSMIIYRGDPGYSLFMILSGSVAATLRNDEGIEYTLSTMEKGDVFGEMALITGEPRSANVRALTDVRMAELYQDAFLDLTATYPKLNESLLHLLTQRRARTAIRRQFINLEREEMLANLFAQEPPEIDQIIGKTKWARDLNETIDKLAFSEKNILILGERGTGKNLAARLIHFRNPLKERPLFHLDCANPPPIQRELRAQKKMEKDALYLEVAQASALFGHGLNAGTYAKSIRRGYIELADGGTVIMENIEFLSPLVQRLLVEYLIGGTFVRRGEDRLITSRVRLIATSSRTLAELKEQDHLNPELLEHIGGEIINMKPLRERKKDIPIIAINLLPEFNKKFSKGVEGFSEEALSSMIDHGWPLNVDELSQVVERAVAVAEGNTVSGGQVFLNASAFSTRGRFNLMRIQFLQKALTHPMFPKGLHIITVPFILGLILFTLIGPLEQNPANLVVWTVWWPVLILSVTVSARSWCGYCPLPVISDGVNHYRKKFLSIPRFFERYGIWIGIAGFILIFIAEHAANMFTMSRATGMLLLTILAGAVTTNLFFGRRSWCKYICPLGKVVAHLSALSLVELGSNTNVCSNQCATHDCVTNKSCPMGLHPAASATSKDCILCFSCAKSCKHQSVRLDMHIPWQDYLIPKKWDVAGSFFSVLLIGLVMAIKLPSWEPMHRILTQYLSFGMFMTDIAVPLFIAAFFTVIVLFASGFPVSPFWKKYFTVSGYAYLFLAFACFFNVYLHELVNNGPSILPWIVDLIGLG
ncbi:MAG TPA: sigma 54-interacting transcriptional regulator, partial [Nitrospirota bacterium]|nr:sigma 54-interacting transcriptional regulator [Nitrospirota bacterium]